MNVKSYWVTSPIPRLLAWWSIVTAGFVATSVPAVVADAQDPVSRPTVSGAPTGTTAFVGVTVIPMDTERVLANQTVLIQGGWVTAVGPVGQVRVPRDAVRIDGRRRYLMPGLADMHVHFFAAKSATTPEQKQAQIERDLFLWLANGVTTVRNMDYGYNDMVLRLRDRAAAGELLSPRLYVAGAWQESIPRFSGHQPENVAARVAAYQAAGYDFLKIRTEPASLYDSILIAARRIGLPVMGHVPGIGEAANNRIALAQALQRGQASIEHLTSYSDELLRGPSEDFNNLDSLRIKPESLEAQRRLIDFTKIPALAAATARAGVWNCPTQYVFDMGSLELGTDTMSFEPELAYVLRTERANWLQQARRSKMVGRGWSTGAFAGLPGSDVNGTLEARRRLIKALQDSGAGLLLGSDLDLMTGTMPGVAAHRELQALVRAGLTPYQALATSTANVAKFAATFFKTPNDAGTVVVGKRADLVLLTGNPLQHIEYAMQPAGVMLGGRWLDRATLSRQVTAIGIAKAMRERREFYESYYGQAMSLKAVVSLTPAQKPLWHPIDLTHEAQWTAFIAALDVNKERALELQQLGQLIGQQLHAYRAQLDPGQQSAFDAKARMLIDVYRKHGYSLAIPGLRS